MQPYIASHLKDMNRRTIYNLIAEREVTSKAELTKLTGISAPTVIKVVGFLIENGLVLELGEGESAIGRKPQLLTLNRDLLYSATIFLEGEFLTLGIVDITGAVRFKKTQRCEPCFDAIMTRVIDGLLDELLAEAGIPADKLLGIGIAIPGIYDPECKTVLTAPLIGIGEAAGIDWAIDSLSQKYGVRVWVENDANAQCVGEFHASKMAEGDDLVFISAGTGIGAGVMLGGRLRRGSRNMCGEIGYLTFDSGYRYSADQPGWLESRLSYRTLEDRFGVDVSTDLTALPEKMLELILEHVASPLALCINNITMLLDCRNVCIGGVVVNMLGERLIEALNRKLSEICIGEIRVREQASDDIGLVGLAAILTERRIHEILSESEYGGKRQSAG